MIHRAVILRESLFRRGVVWDRGYRNISTFPFVWRYIEIVKFDKIRKYVDNLLSVIRNEANRVFFKPECVKNWAVP